MRPLKIRLRRAVSEIFGRITADNSFLKSIKLNFSSLLAQDITADLDKPDYDLSKEVFWASQGASDKAKKMLLGAIFAKPIVNTSAAFSIGEPYKIKANDLSEDETEQKVNAFMRDNHDDIFKWVRNGFRDGDSYLRVYKDGTVERIPPKTVKIITEDHDIGLIIGYDITQIMQEENKKITFVEELRTVSPFRVVKRYEGSSKEFTIVEGTEDNGTGERRLPLISFQNEKEARALHGYSEYQNLYYLFAQYHKIGYSTIRNFVYNSNSVMSIGGVDDINKFKEDNFDTDKNGNPVLDIDEKKVIIGGTGFKMESVQGKLTAGEAKILLGLIFLMIIDASETPEFVFGGGMQSSKASVSEQMPVVVKKAIRNQTQLIKPMKNLVDTYIEIASKFDTNITTIDYILVTPPIVDEDKTLNLKVIDTLSRLGLVSDKLAYELAGVTVDDIDEEIDQAKQDQVEKNQANDIFANNPQDQAEAIEKQMAESKALDKREKELDEEKDKISEQRKKTDEKLKTIKTKEKKISVKEIEVEKNISKSKKILNKAKNVR